MSRRRPQMSDAEVMRLRDEELWRAENARKWEIATGGALIPSPEDRRHFERLIGTWAH